VNENPQDGSRPSVVLVHGGFADGSGWQGVYDQLKDDYNVRIVQEPNLSHGGDVEATKMIIDAQSEPVVLVGHSYGGAVITEAGNHPKVAALVYIAAFVPDRGESVETILGGPFRPASRTRETLSCRLRTASCSSTGKSSMSNSRAT
jgi:pimeloyl-ACP methyl ester carboxylesterase